MPARRQTRTVLCALMGYSATGRTSVVEVTAVSMQGIRVPVVVRMEGTNVEEGRRILADSGLDLITAVDLKDAAQKVADIVKDG